MSLELNSPCKVNLLLNILGRRPDGFHELETVLQPLPIHDRLRFEKGMGGLQLTSSEPSLPVDGSNLVHRAARAFLEAAGVSEGVRIHLEKNLPMAAGLGGGSANAATTLLGLNRLFGDPLTTEALTRIARTLGSDVPFFLQEGPALGTGRGECIQPVASFKALRGAGVLLIRPGFGVSTAWAYRELSKEPSALNGEPGKASALIDRLRTSDLRAAAPGFFNSLERPVFRKYPVLQVLKDFLLNQGAVVALMSGSGSTTFAITPSPSVAESLRERVLAQFGEHQWTAITPL